jgi:hypothetical protein
MKNFNELPAEYQERINDAAKMKSFEWYGKHQAGDYIEYRTYAERYGLINSPLVETFAKKAIQMAVMDMIENGVTDPKQLASWLETYGAQKTISRYFEMLKAEFGK